MVVRPLYQGLLYVYTLYSINITKTPEGDVSIPPKKGDVHRKPFSKRGAFRSWLIMNQWFQIERAWSDNSDVKWPGPSKEAMSHSHNNFSFKTNKDPYVFFRSPTKKNNL